MAFTDRLHQLVADKSDRKQFSGVALIQREEDTVFEAACGYANRSWRVKNQVDTRFRIASVTKMFTAVAVLQLIDAGKLALGTSAVEFLELENTKIPREATVYHLLTMTSGIGDHFEESRDWDEVWAEISRQHPTYLLQRNKDYLPLFANKAPVSPVGERYQYNNAGYVLLGLAIERATGVSYFDHVRQHIFAKARMSRSDFLTLDGVHDEVADGYIPVTGEREEIVDWKKSTYAAKLDPAADGGATSTAGDLVRCMQALRNGLLLSGEMTHEMLTPKVAIRDNWRGGYGIYFTLDEKGRIVRWGRMGEDAGESCRLYHYPAVNLDVIVVGNQSWCAGELASKIHDLILEEMP